MTIQGGNVIASITGGVFSTASGDSPTEASDSLLDTPADIMYAWLEANGYVSDPTNKVAWPMYTGFLPDGYPSESPQDATAIFDSDGVKDAKTMYGSVIQKYGLQILVRSSVYTAGWKKAEALGVAMDALAGDVITNGVNTYELHNASRSGPVVSMGRDPKRSSMFSLNFLLTLKRII